MTAVRPVGRLDREVVLATALALVDREGLDALTMRRLAVDLGVEAMAIYRHAENKEALLDGLVEVVMAELVVDPFAEDWRVELHRLVANFRRVCLEHPEVVPLIALRPLVVPLSRRPKSELRISEQVFELLRQNGFDDPAAVTCYRRLVGWMTGWVLVELRELVDNPEESEPGLRLGLQRLPPSEFPRLRVMAIALSQHDAEEDLHHGLDALLAGWTQ